MKDQHTILIGRSLDCDYVIYDPSNRVSRRHLSISKADGGFRLTDLGSKNGTYVNGNKILPHNPVRITSHDQLTLSKDYRISLKEIFNHVPLDDDRTIVLSSGHANNVNVLEDSDKTIIQSGGRKIAFEKDKVSLSDISEMDSSMFKTIGRSNQNDIVISKANVSRNHCRIRLMGPMIIEVEDLQSANGTYADGIRLVAEKKYRFASNVKIGLANEMTLDLKRIFPEIIIAPKIQPHNVAQAPGSAGSLITPAERMAFNELKNIWEEYQKRQLKMSNIGNNYSLGGMLVGGIGGIILTVATGGAAALAAGGVAMGGSVLGRYLGMQKTNELRDDMTYEEMFLQAYSCPRCKESFQKKPWTTINNCFVCKVKFR